MERPNAATIAAYNLAIPAYPRAVKGQMFGHPCAFVNGNMFFGTFAQTVVARVGEARTASLSAAQEAVVFIPMPGRPWKEYIQLHPTVVSAERLAAYALEALEHTAGMPPKVEKPKKATSGSPRKAAKASK